MHRTNIYLTEEQERALDAMARARGTTRSHTIRGILDQHLRVPGADADVTAALVAAGDAVGDALGRLFESDDDLAVR